MTIYLIPINRITANPWQTRQGDPDPDYIKELALDIAANGLLQTPVGRLVNADNEPVQPDVLTQEVFDLANLRVQLAFGHNRLTAFRRLYDTFQQETKEKWSSMPIEIGPLTDEQMADFAWSENERRRDHTPLERALAIQKRMEHFGWSQQQVADHLGISRPVVSNAIRLLKLPDDVRQKLHNGHITERQAIAILELLSLPESLRNKASANWQINTNPNNIFADALHGESSETTRKRIEMLIESFCRKLEEAAWQLDEQVPGTEVFPVCRTCENRLISRNACMDLACFGRKDKAARAAYLQRASEASGIPPLESDKGSYDVTQFGYSVSPDALKTILQSGCQNLRLMYADHSRWHTPSDDLKILAGQGFPNAEIVCAKRSGYCTCIKGIQHLTEDQKRIQAAAEQDAAERYDDDVPDEDDDPEDGDSEVDVDDTPETINSSTGPTAAELEEAARLARASMRRAAKLQKKICELAGQRLWQAMEDRSPLAWRIFAHHTLGWQMSFDKTQGIFTDFTSICYELSRLAAKNIMPLNTPGSVDALLARVNQDLRRAGVSPITDADIADDQ